MEYEITKGNTKIKIKPKKYVDKYGKLEIEIGMNNKNLYAKDYDEDDNVIRFYGTEEIEGRKVNGIRIDDEDIAKQLAELKEEAKKERKEKIQMAFDDNLRLGFYFGDWYRVNVFFIEFECGGRKETEIVMDEINSFAGKKYNLTITREETVKRIEKLFNFRDLYTKEEIEKLKKEIQKKYNLKIEAEEINDLRGKGWYVSDVVGGLKDWEKILDKIYVPIMTEKEKKKIEYEKQKEAALQKAKETGEKVIIRRMGSYDGDDWQQVKMFGTSEIKENYPNEYGLIKVYEVATADGKIREEHSLCY